MFYVQFLLIETRALFVFNKSVILNKSNNQVFRITCNPNANLLANVKDHLLEGRKEVIHQLCMKNLTFISEIPQDLIKIE